MKKSSFVKGALAALASASFLAIAAPAVADTPAVGPDVSTGASIVQQQQQTIVEYKGADNAAALSQQIIGMSQQKPTFVMFYDPNCPHCKDLTQYFGDAKSQTQLDYQVLRVSVTDYQNTVNQIGVAKQGVPETHVFINGYDIYSFVGAPKDVAPLVNFMNQLDQAIKGAAQNQNQQQMSIDPSFKAGAGPVAFKAGFKM